MRYALPTVGLFGIILMAGCANPYQQFYRGSADARTLNNYVPPSGPLQIYSTNNFARDIESLERRGYFPIGESAFNAASNRASERQLREQAEKLGAFAVLVSSRYTNTVTGAVPLVLPNTTTSVTSGNATVTGMGGVANVYGTATTTTYGTQTTMLPYSIDRSDFDAVYFYRPSSHFGAIYGTIDNSTRARLQTNAGVLIKVVVEGSPVGRADVLPGDIVLTVDGQRVDGPEALNALVKARYGSEIVLGIDRNGQHLDKKLTLPP